MLFLPRRWIYQRRLEWQAFQQQYNEVPSTIAIGFFGARGAAHTGDPIFPPDGREAYFKVDRAPFAPQKAI